MPLRLKSLELQGYKTFAGKTEFEFAGGITAIVGPNGSGKSNIADALRWVLGEQSFSLLRAKKTEDMIFAGSEHRPRVGMASATATFDNSNGWLPVDFSEVTVTRRAYRDGHNEYLLNSQHVRLKDIYELLAQSGLAERTYTILGQGLVDASLALKADDRRRLFEEAAGIGLYRTRREESLHRLETTQRNLDRVLDILAELEPRLKSLERQSRRAQEYIQVQADLRLLLRDWYGFHWHSTQRELTEIREVSHEHDARLQMSREAYQAVRANFVIFRDHLQGLRTQLNSWLRQASVLHDQRETIIRNLAVLDERCRATQEIHQNVLDEQLRLTEELRVATERHVEMDSETNRLATEFDEAEEQEKAARDALASHQAEKEQVESDLQSTRYKLGDLITHRAQSKARLDELAIRVENQKQKLDSVTKAITDAEIEVEKTQDEYHSTLFTCQQAEKDLQNTEIDLQAARNHLAELEEKYKEKQTVRATKLGEQVRLKTQIDVLEQAAQSLSGYADGAKLLLDAARQLNIKGFGGALSAVLDVPAELEIAITAALGEYTDAILIQSGYDAEQALSMLDSDQSGRASLLPMDWLVHTEPLKAKRDGDCLGVAVNLVKAPVELRPVMDLLLGQTLIVRDRKVARKLLAGQPRNVRVVTIRGEVFNASGPVLAGKSTSAAAFSRPRQKRDLQEALTIVDRQIIKLDSELQKLTEQIEPSRKETSKKERDVLEKRAGFESARANERKVRVKYESAQLQQDWQVSQQESLKKEIAQAKLERESVVSALTQSEAEIGHMQDEIRGKNTAMTSLTLDEFHSQVTYWSTRLAVARRALSDTRTRLDEHQQAVIRLQDEQAALEIQLVELNSSKSALEGEKENLRNQEGNLNSQLEELVSQIGRAEKELETAETQEVILQEQETESQQSLTKEERLHTQVQLDLGRKQESLDLLRQKIEDDFGLVAFEYNTDVSGPVPLPFKGIVEQLSKVTELPPNLEENLIRQRSQLRRMGAVNLEAQQEYDSVKERYEFLHTQLNDLNKAEADLRQVITELDELTKKEFFKTFLAVAEEFHGIFHRLFGGGSARLMLTDPENLTETGIDIETRLPGRHEQGLSLLSGGERSLTAIALVFALLKISPTPVCVLDEVDAMLDEANVGRFRELLLELSKDTQFVIITHNRNTVQAADVIYGVTMGRDSTSQVISLKLDEISEKYLK